MNTERKNRDLNIFVNSAYIYIHACKHAYIKMYLASARSPAMNANGIMQIIYTEKLDNELIS